MTAEGTDPRSTSPGPWIYTTRLQKGGALIADMRQLVRAWSDAPVAAQRESGVRSNILNKDTRTRLADVYQRAFLPRFVSGPIPQSWKLVRPLEDVGAPIHIVRPVYYWISAKAEPLLGDFCREFILPRYATVRGGIGTEDVLTWLSGKECPWSEAATIRVARGLLASTLSATSESLRAVPESAWPISRCPCRPSPIWHCVCEAKVRQAVRSSPTKTGSYSFWRRGT